MSDVLLSICISSYNHGDKCVQLVNSILSVKDNRYNIIVCDDYSDKSTIKELKTISNSRVILVQNKRNLGACKNWFQTIDSGTGQYLLHVLDRDTISTKYLPHILDILEQDIVGGGYFGKSSIYPVKEVTKNRDYAICKKGREAFLTMAGVPIHPTGFFVKRAIWKMGNYKKFFYQSDKYGIYPHSYVLGEAAVQHDMVFSSIPFCSYTYRGSNKVSRFYEKKDKKEYWWLPENVMKTHNCLTFYLSRFADESYKTEFICRRFKDALDRSTIAYKRVSANQQEMEHYGLTVHYISDWELLRISITYKMSFGQILKKMETNEREIRKQLNDIWLENMKTIVKGIKKSKTDELLALSNKNLLYFQIMNQFVKAKQQKNNLSRYFEDRGYSRIAIYGMGIIGQTLLDELQGTSVEVVYGIDRNAEQVYSTVDVLSLDSSFPAADVVVVTIAESFDTVLQDLEKKVDCPVISVRDVVYDT